MCLEVGIYDQAQGAVSPTINNLPLWGPTHLHTSLCHLPTLIPAFLREENQSSAGGFHKVYQETLYFL
jgi:hypothetical protein